MEVQPGAPAPPPRLEPVEIPLEVLYEDADLAVLNKPAGMVVHPAPGHRLPTLVHALLARWPALPEGGTADRPGIVHRLDKETSGLILVALTPRARLKLSEAFAERTIHKRYLALVVGHPPEGVREGLIDLPIRRHPWDRTKMAVGAGRPARTRWRLVEPLGGSSLLEAFPETGRTHQIRVHLASVGLPIVGDPVYGGRGRARGIADEALRTLLLSFRRPLLHAAGLELDHPTTGAKLRVAVDPPEDFRSALEALRAWKGPG